MEVWEQADKLTDLSKYGVYYNKELYINAKERDCITLVGCEGAIYFDQPRGYHLTLVGSSMDVYARNYAVVAIDKDGRSKCEVSNEDGTAIIN